MRFTFMQDPLTNSLAALGWNKAKQMLSAVVDATKNLIDNTKSVVSNIWNADYTQLKATQLVIYPAIKNTIVNNKNLILSAAASTLMLAVLGINARGRGFTDLLALGYYTINAAGIAFPAFVMGKCIKEVYAEIKRLIAQGVEVYEEVDDRYHQGKKNYGSVNRERLAKVIEYTDGNYWEWSDVTIKNIAKASLNLANKSLNLVNKVIKPSLNWFEKRKFVNDKVKPVLNGVVKTINYASDKVVKPSLNFSKDKVIKPGLNFAKDNVVKPGLNWVFVKPINYAKDKAVKPGLNIVNDKVVKPGLNFVNDKVVKPGINWMVVKPTSYLIEKLVPQKIKDTLAKYLPVKEIEEPYDAEEDMQELADATEKPIKLKGYFNAIPTNNDTKNFNPLAYSTNPLDANIKPEYRTPQGHLWMKKFKGDPYYDNLINNSMEEEEDSIAHRVVRNRRGYS